MTDSDLQPQVADPGVNSPDSGGGTAPRAVRRSMFEDPMVRWMGAAALAMLVLYLATILGALLTGVISTAKAPRTAAERALAVAETRYQAKDRTAAEVGKYVDALIRMKRYSKAQSVIDATIKKVDQTRGAEITLEQARLYLAKGEYKKAIEEADKARAIMQARYDKEMSTDAVTESRSYGLPEPYKSAVLVQADAYSALKDWDNAIIAYNDYLPLDEGAADIMVLRGLAKIQAGDTKGAEKDLKQALKYMPEDEKALAGLKKIGADE